MKYAKILGLLAMLVFLVSLTGCERRIVVEGDLDQDPKVASYVGSNSCGVSGCHESIYESFIKTGHPYKLNKAADAQQSDYYPFTEVPDPPAIIGNDWSSVSYVIGGHRWKARYVDSDGYIVTGDAVQWNFETGAWVGYHADEGLGTKPYDCGPCHTTGYKNQGNQDDKPGLIGQWDEGGVHCEECHGNGEFHVKDPVNNDMTIDRSSDMCGQCHVRGTPYAVPASGGFIKHHEQYNEILGSKHSVLECVDCHNPHLTLHPDEPSRELAIRRECESCHHGEANSYDNSTLPHAGENIDCIDCHMPRAGKSAVADSDDFYGDIRSHLFTVNTLADAEQFTPDGKFANPYLTLQYMCTNCHTDKDVDWMAQYAHDIHDHGETGSGGTQLRTTAVSQAPVIDGILDAVWSEATALEVQTGVNAGYQKAFGEVDVKLKAVTHNNNLYVLAQWEDPAPGGPTESIHKSEWSFSGGEWSKSSESEDRLFIMFDGGDNGSEGADCASMCHKPQANQMATTGGGHVDVWHWKAARTNPSAPGSPGRADDKWWDGTGRGSDAKDASWYSDNVQDDGSGGVMPKYMHTDGPNYTGDFLFDADKVSFDPNLNWEGKSIPFYVVNPAATGSRWDVLAKGVYSNGIWTVEFGRLFNTGNADDVVLGSGSVQMSIAVTDNSGGDHSGAQPFDLEF